MSQDPIRQACEVLIEQLDGWINSTYNDDLLIAFAKSQRAAVWQEVIGEANQRSYAIGRNEPLHTNHLAIFRDWCEQRAKSLEECGIL